MRSALVMVLLIAATAAQARDTQSEGVCEILRQMADLAAEAEVAARAASDLGKTGLEGVSSDRAAVEAARDAEAKALAIADEAAALARSLVHSGEELCPNRLKPN